MEYTSVVLQFPAFVKLVSARFLMIGVSYLTVTTLWANSTDGKLTIFFSLSTENRICQNLFSGENKKSILICQLLKGLPRVLSFK